ncbi:hypothetical protein CY34DRAFT_248944 [Suillus luteus UH-Slu-Lm8-n1]|uniref:Uncharacterized protein n=1 Tax=Suillus luteus UH-Slu-Lm8-n1 TaxID=930992 RepID=A0A0D0AAZ0_9AGAM|nr:hypothetical protein CY34DRAFT_248944 [Suillus luteus UH-Slu-Lm8-n1]
MIQLTTSDTLASYRTRNYKLSRIFSTFAFSHSCWGRQHRDGQRLGAKFQDVIWTLESTGQ